MSDQVLFNAPFGASAFARYANGSESRSSADRDAALPWAKLVEISRFVLEDPPASEEAR